MLFTELFNVFVRIAGKLGVSSDMKMRILTGIDKSAWLALAELPGLVGEGDLHDAGDVAGRGLHSDGVRGDQLRPDRDRAEDHLWSIVKYIVTLHNIILRTCMPSKKFSPMMTTVWPPAVQPSLGEIALTWDSRVTTVTQNTRRT